MMLIIRNNWIICNMVGLQINERGDSGGVVQISE